MKLNRKFITGIGLAIPGIGLIATSMRFLKESFFRNSMSGPALYGIGILGGVLVLAGIVVALLGFKGINKNKQLIASGIKMDCEITGVLMDRSISVNGQHPHMVQCSWLNNRDGVTYHFSSEHIWYDPSRVITECSIQTLPVYYDPQDLSKYYVLLDALTTQKAQWEAQNVHL